MDEPIKLIYEYLRENLGNPYGLVFTPPNSVIVNDLAGRRIAMVRSVGLEVWLTYCVDGEKRFRIAQIDLHSPDSLPDMLVKITH
jgi:hypothetical protein